MSSTLTLIQTAGTALAAMPLGQVFRTATACALAGGVAMFFRPLLVGVVRATVLTLRPRPPKTMVTRH
jgi:hypothetical protein